MPTSRLGTEAISFSGFIARPTNSFGAGSAAYSAPGANLAVFLAFWIDGAGAVDRILWDSSAAATGNYDVGIYDSVNIVPTNRLVSLGSTATPAAGRHATAIAAISLQPGLYWAAIVFDNGTSNALKYPTMDISPACALVPSRYQQTVFPLPATTTTPTASYGDGWCILAGKS